MRRQRTPRRSSISEQQVGEVAAQGSTASSLVWVDGQILDVDQLSDDLKLDLGRLLGMSPAVYLTGTEQTDSQIELLARSAKVLGYAGFHERSIRSDILRALEGNPGGTLVAALVPLPSSHKAAPPGTEWFAHIEPFADDERTGDLTLAFSPIARNHLSPTANLLLWDDLELELPRRGLADALIWLNLDGHVACADRSAVLIREGEELLTPPLRDGAIESGWRGLALSSGQVIESTIGTDRLLCADQIFCLTPWGRKLEVTSVEMSELTHE